MKSRTFGSVTLHCGDSRDLAPTLTYNAVVTDPPYGMGFQSNHRNVQWHKIANDETEDLLHWACALAPSHSSYIFCRWDNLISVPKPRSLITWVKNNWSMGDLEHAHARQTETILFYPGPDHQFPSGRPSDVIYSPRTKNSHHPTEKPIQLMKAIIGWTEGIVFDPFVGGGAAACAALLASRRFVGVELDETHFDIACTRVQSLHRTLDKARRVAA